MVAKGWDVKRAVAEARKAEKATAHQADAVSPAKAPQPVTPHQWRIARDIVAKVSERKSVLAATPFWPDAFTARELSALQYPADSQPGDHSIQRQRRTLEATITEHIDAGTVPTVACTWAVDTHEQRPEDPLTRAWRQRDKARRLGVPVDWYSRDFGGSAMVRVKTGTTERSAPGLRADVAQRLFAESGIRPSEHLSAWHTATVRQTNVEQLRVAAPSDGPAWADSDGPALQKSYVVKQLKQRFPVGFESDMERNEAWAVACREPDGKGGTVHGKYLAAKVEREAEKIWPHQARAHPKRVFAAEHADEPVSPEKARRA